MMIANDDHGVVLLDAHYHLGGARASFIAYRRDFMAAF